MIRFFNLSSKRRLAQENDACGCSSTLLRSVWHEICQNRKPNFYATREIILALGNYRKYDIKTGLAGRTVEIGPRFRLILTSCCLCRHKSPLFDLRLEVVYLPIAPSNSMTWKSATVKRAPQWCNLFAASISGAPLLSSCSKFVGMVSIQDDDISGEKEAKHRVECSTPDHHHSKNHFAASILGCIRVDFVSYLMTRGSSI